MSIKRSIVIGQPKETQGADQEEKKTSKKSVASVKKGSLERTAPVGIVHDKTVLKSIILPPQGQQYDLKLPMQLLHMG